MRSNHRGFFTAVAVLSAAGAAHAAISIDGSLDSDYGAPIVLQKNVSNGGNAQLSNVYGQIDTVNNKLNLFFGGSLLLGNGGPDQQFVLVLQTGSGGVSNLHSSTSLAQNDGGANGGASTLEQIGFDTGFAGTSLFTFKFDGGRESDFFDLTTTDVNNVKVGTHVGYGFNANPTSDDSGQQTRSATGAPTYTIEVNNALAGTSIGSGGMNPGFADPTTGAEIQIDLAALGYTGGDVKALAFVTEGSFHNITNQVLAPYDYNPDHAGDYPYLDANRQFDNDSFYDGNQYFTISVPEPASLSLLGLVGLAATRRRRTR